MSPRGSNGINPYKGWMNENRYIHKENILNNTVFDVCELVWAIDIQNMIDIYKHKRKATER